MVFFDGDAKIDLNNYQITCNQYLWNWTRNMMQYNSIYIDDEYIFNIDSIESSKIIEQFSERKREKCIYFMNFFSFEIFFTLVLAFFCLSLSLSLSQLFIHYNYLLTYIMFSLEKILYQVFSFHLSHQMIFFLIHRDFTSVYL